LSRFLRVFTWSDEEMGPRHLLTIIVLFVPDAFFLLAGDANSGYLSFVYRNRFFCRHLAAPVGARNTDRGLTRNLGLEGLGLC